MPKSPPAAQSFLSATDAATSAPWAAMPYDDTPRFDTDSVRRQWQRLHAGQGRMAAAPPQAADLLQGWTHFHNGEFERAAGLGRQHGGADGLALAHRATAIYANYLAPREATRLALYRQVADSAATQAEAAPDDVQAHYWHAYALGRYSQGVSVARALAQGLGGKVKGALEHAIALDPSHADAHFALGTFHAEVIDKVGQLVGRITYGAQPEMAIACFERGLTLHPESPTGLMEYAHALVMLHGEGSQEKSAALLQRVAALTPVDARERLDVALARAALTD